MSQVQEVKQAVNIVDVIGERLDLKRAGSSYKALCPFHSESSPSFFVNEQMQRYKCFGCDASGDVIEFLEQYEGMTFLEALQHLADRVGIELKRYQASSDDKLRQKLLQILDLARQYYHYLLTEHNLGQKARQYLDQRGVNQTSLDLFQLGYALPAWDGLFKYLTQKKNFKPDEVVKTGLVVETKTGRHYDRFRSRIMFPLKNHRGQVVGFSGRILQSQDNAPKYMNTPETKVYHKSRMLYGYHELYQQIRQAQEVIICEGEFDVISSSQAHVGQVSAIKGSALTAEQARLINRSVDKVLLCLDADEAGVKATKRAASVIQDTDLELRIIDLSQVELDKEAGVKIKDADDLARYDPKLWRQTVKNSISVYDFLINSALDQFDASTPEGKRQIVDELAPTLNQISHQVEKQFYLDKLAQKLKVNAGALAADIRNFGQDQSYQSRRQRRRLQSVPEEQKQMDPGQNLQRYLLFLLFRMESDQVKRKAQQLAQYSLSVVGAKQVLQAILDWEQNFALKAFSRSLAEDLKAKVFAWYQQPEFVELLPEIDLQVEWRQTLKKLKSKLIKQEIKELSQKLEKLDRKTKLTTTEQAKQEKWLKRIVKLQNQLGT